MTRPTTSTARSRRRLLAVGAGAAIAFAVFAGVQAPGTFADTSRPTPAKPTVVLVHGAWADASGWSGVISRLETDGYSVVAPPNPLRSLSGDAAYLRSYLDTITGPIVLVGHSYGGAVITNAATGDQHVRALVYIDAFAPDKGQTALQLAGRDSAFTADPSTIFNFVPPTQPTAPTTDVYQKTSVFLSAFANGLPNRQARVLAAAQRPITFGALVEPSGAPAWRTIPSWYLIGTQDQIIPPSAEQIMARHAGSKVSYFDAGHLGLISKPGSVTNEIEHAARATS